MAIAAPQWLNPSLIPAEPCWLLPWEALNNRSVACAPVSGFHHACFDHAEGFCTFNGLMVTALALKQEGSITRVGILDLDHHFGNGTVDIVKQTRASWIHHHSSGLHFPEPKDAHPYLDRLANLVNTFMDCDILLYQGRCCSRQ